MYYHGKDLEEYIHNLGQAIIDYTKNDLSNFHITFKKPNHNAPKSIKGDYDLSIHGNKIVLVDNVDGTTVEAKCHPDDDFDIGVGIKEAFKKLNEKREELRKQKEEEEKKIKVGDWVEVVDIGFNYPCYWEWMPNNKFSIIKNFEYMGRPHSKFCKVMYLGQHKTEDTQLAFIQDKEGLCHTIGVKGLKKVVKPNV